MNNGKNVPKIFNLPTSIMTNNSFSCKEFHSRNEIIFITRGVSQNCYLLVLGCHDADLFGVCLLLLGSLDVSWKGKKGQKHQTFVKKRKRWLNIKNGFVMPKEKNRNNFDGFIFFTLVLVQESLFSKPNLVHVNIKPGHIQ